MRYFKIPPDIQLVNPSSKKMTVDDKPVIISFREHALAQWLSDRRWYTPITRLARLLKIQELIGAKEGTEVAIEDADWEILKEIIQSPDMNLLAANPIFQVQLLPFGDTVLAATDQAATRVIENKAGEM